MMACQPAINIGITTLVALHAEAHPEIHRRQAVHCLHFPVAFDAIEFCPTDMGLVPKFNMVRNVEDANPGDRRIRVEMLLLLNNLRMHRNYVLMAIKALLHWRNLRRLGTFNKGVAEAAIYLFYSRVHPMAEVDGLLRPYLLNRVAIVKVQHHHNKNDGDPEPGDPLPGIVDSLDSLFLLFGHIDSPFQGLRIRLFSSFGRIHELMKKRIRNGKYRISPKE